MYCVIQELQLKKPNKHGYSKTLESYSFTINGAAKYCWRYGEERFERPIRTAYKISIHKSKRVNGVVTKEQYTVTTVGYYDLVDYWIGDCMIASRPKELAEKLGTDEQCVWDLINAKVDPLQERIQAEFKKTVEYKTHAKHRKNIEAYNKAKAKFAKTYNCDDLEYDYCYNVFGELMNSSYFDKVVEDFKRRRSYQRQTHSNYSNFDWSDFNFNGSSYLNSASSNYTVDEKEMLKKFYRTLSKTYHPDNIQGDGSEMILINRLKEAWGI